MVEKQDYETMLIRYLKGEATPEEAMTLEDWIAEKEENKTLYSQYERLIHGDQVFQKPDEDEAWARIQKSTSPIGRIVHLNKRIFWTSAVAALLIIGILLFNFQDTLPKKGVNNQNHVTTNTSAGVMFAEKQSENFTLSDQSTVELKKGSSLELAKDFGKGQRRSKLKGSGRFSVIHDEANPFIIEVSGLEVHDIGTVFDIQSMEDTVKVVVHEGAVELRLNNETLAMEAGDSAFYVISEQLIQAYAAPEARKDVIFNFDGTTLSEVATILNSFFSKNIVIVTEELKTCKITIVFKNKSLAEILEYIKLTLDLNMVYKPSKIEIYGEGC